MSAKSFKKKISKSVVDSLEQDRTVWDTSLSGFGARRQKGKPAYIVKCRVDGRQVLHTIGQHGAWTPDTARKKAQQILVDANNGINPNQVRKSRKQDMLVSEGIEKFLVTHVSRLRSKTQDLYRYLLKDLINPALGKTKLKDVQKSDISKLHLKHRDLPYKANRILAVVSCLLTHAEDWGERDEGTNPCRYIKKFPEKARERFLSKEELGRFIRTLETAWPSETYDGPDWSELTTKPKPSPLAVGAIWLLLLTGCRKGEILSLQWDFIDLDRKTISLPETKSKPRIVHLTDEALDVLNRLPRQKDHAYVFPSFTSLANATPRSPHLTDVKKPFKTLTSISDIPNLRIHDLRHTYASYAAMDGSNAPTLMALLGHSQASTTMRYTHLADESIKIAQRRAVASMLKNK